MSISKTSWNNMQKMSPEHEWIKRMVGHLSNIIKSNLGIQFQSSYYFHYQTLHTGLDFEEERKQSKTVYEPPKAKRNKATVSQSVYVEDVTVDTEQGLNYTHNTSDQQKKHKLDKSLLDDTGYETLQLEGDTFFDRINLIKQHLEREDHPLNQFWSCFDQEFSDYYLIFVANGADKDRKF